MSDAKPTHVVRDVKQSTIDRCDYSDDLLQKLLQFPGLLAATEASEDILRAQVELRQLKAFVETGVHREPFLDVGSALECVDKDNDVFLQALAAPSDTPPMELYNSIKEALHELRWMIRALVVGNVLPETDRTALGKIQLPLEFTEDDSLRVSALVMRMVRAWLMMADDLVAKSPETQKDLRELVSILDSGQYHTRGWKFSPAAKEVLMLRLPKYEPATVDQISEFVRTVRSEIERLQYGVV